MIKKEMIAMLLAGGQGSRLGVLTQSVAKPAVGFGGKYRIIDFPLSNCIYKRCYIKCSIWYLFQHNIRFDSDNHPRCYR